MKTDESKFLATAKEWTKKCVHHGFASAWRWLLTCSCVGTLPGPSSRDKQVELNREEEKLSYLEHVVSVPYRRRTSNLYPLCLVFQVK